MVMRIHIGILGRTLKAATCLVALFVSFADYAMGLAPEGSDQVLVIGARLDGRLDEDPKSGYNQLAADIFGEADTVQFQRLPMVRAITTFKRDDRACLMPTSPDIMAVLGGIDSTLLVASDPIDIVSSHFFFRTEAEIDQQVYERPDRHVAKQSGLNLQELLGDKLKARFTHVPEMLMALRMLDARRVDAMYAWYPDVMIISERDGIATPFFEIEAAHITIQTSLVCKNFEGVSSLLAGFNRRLAFLRESGKLKEMLGPYARLAVR